MKYYIFDAFFYKLHQLKLYENDLDLALTALLDYSVKHNRSYVILKITEDNIDANKCNIMDIKFPSYYTKYNNKSCNIRCHKIYERNLNDLPKTKFKLQLLNTLLKYDKKILYKIYKQSSLKKRTKIFTDKHTLVRKLFFYDDIDNIMTIA